MTFWDGLLLVIAVTVAVRSLTGMMRRRADRLVAEVQKQVDHHREQAKSQRRRERQNPVQDAA